MEIFETTFLRTKITYGVYINRTRVYCIYEYNII